MISRSAVGEAVSDSIKVTLAILVTIAASVGSYAQSADHEPHSIRLLFAEPIPKKWPPNTESNNPILSDLLRSSKEPTILLASDAARASLLVSANKSGFGALIPLPVEGFGLHLAEGSGDTLWIGGFSKPSTSASGTQLSFAYLAKVDRQGHLSWAREFGGQSARTIQSMVSLPSGDIAVSGQDSSRTWLARISKEGSVVWERFVGLGKGSAVTAINGIIILAAVESGSSDASYREDVAAWTFNETGELLDHRAIREGISNDSGDRSGEIRIETAGDFIYFFSAWKSFTGPKPLEVAKLDPRAGVVWRKQLATTIIHLGNRSAHYCSTAITVLSNGDPLIACRSKDDEIELSRLNAKTGVASRSDVLLPPPPPHCSEFWSPVRFLKESSQTTIWFVGSPQSAGDKPCGWIGEAPMPGVE